MAVSVTDAALVLRRAGGTAATESMIRDDIIEGASTNADGTLNLVRYAGHG
jgi:hypothetical protein